ncbi:MAG: FHA domain-containing protein [Cellvibrio sp.]
MYKLQSLTAPFDAYWLHESRYLLGDHAEADIVIEGQGANTILASILREGESYAIKDHQSPKGLFVNGHRVTHKTLQLGDQITVGDYRFALQAPKAVATDKFAGNWQLFLETGLAKSCHFPLAADTQSLLGRSPECALVINNPHIARKQLSLTPTSQGLEIRNLAPRQTLFVNESAVESAILQNGDRLRLDIFRFFVVAPFDHAEPTAASPMQHQPTNSQAKPSTLSPRRWKTKPTSPGNRYDYPLEQPRSYKGAALMMLILVVACCAGLLLW